MDRRQHLLTCFIHVWMGEMLTTTSTRIEHDVHVIKDSIKKLCACTAPTQRFSASRA